MSRTRVCHGSLAKDRARLQKRYGIFINEIPWFLRMQMRHIMLFAKEMWNFDISLLQKTYWNFDISLLQKRCRIFDVCKRDVEFRYFSFAKEMWIFDVCLLQKRCGILIFLFCNRNVEF